MTRGGTIWLIVGSQRVLLDVADTTLQRARGLLGRRDVDGAILLTPASAVHTVGMRFAIDVAHLDADMRVLRTTTMRPHRLGRTVRGGRKVLEARAGAFAQWGLRVGDQLAIESSSGTDPGRAAA